MMPDEFYELNDRLDARGAYGKHHEPRHSGPERPDGPEMAHGHPAPTTVDVVGIREGHMPVLRTKERANDGKGGLYGWTLHHDPPICAACREPWGADGCTVVRLCDALEAERARVAELEAVAIAAGNVNAWFDGAGWLGSYAQDVSGELDAALAALAASRGGSGAG